jgi:hypothetical protein
MQVLTKIVIAVVLMVPSKISFSQTGKERSENESKHFTVNFDYLSDYLVNGRKDSLRSPYAVAGFQASSSGGFTLNTNFYYLLQKNNRKLDFFELLLSYEKELSDQLLLGIYGAKYFSGASRNTLNSDIGASLGIGVGYDFSFVKFFTQADWLINSKSDISLTLELLKEFEIKKGAFTYSFSPQADMYYSTLGYYEGTITKNTQRRNGRAPILAQPPYVSTSVVNPRFQWMAFELALPFTIENNSWGFSFTTTLACPVNPVNTKSVVTIGNTNITINSTPYSERVMNPTFYSNLSFFIKF